MFGGQLPFMGEHDQAVVYSILNKKPKPITELRSEIPVSIAQVVDKALEKNPDKRYQQIDELLDDLKSISAGIVPEEIKVRLRKAKLRKRKRAILYAGAVGLVIVMAVLTLTLFTGRAEAIDSIAVLPLENLTGDSEQEYFVDGVTDELIGQLGQISGLQRVISRTSVMRYKNTDKSLPEIARELKVDALVEGTVYQIGENVSIKLQLFDALPEERSLWTKRYDRPVTDVLVMYGEMAGSIADNIQVKLTPQEEIRLAGARQVNPEAYKAYLKGQFYFAKFTPPDLETALHFYQMALDRDPDYALAYAGIAMLWGARGQFGILPPNEAAQQARAAVEKALELNSSLAEVQYALASIRAYHDWDWEGAEAAFKKAIELNPNFPDVRSLYSHFLCIMNRPDEALEQTGRAMELDPFSDLIQGWHGWVLYMLRRYDDALAQFQRMIRTSPNHAGALGGLAAVFNAKGMYDESLAAWQSAYVVFGFDQAEEALALGYSEGGYRGAMRRLGDTWATLRNVSYILPTDIANSYFLAGENSLALDWLERGFEERDSNMPYLSAYPMYDPLRSYPRFQDLLRKMNLPVDEKE
jgi:TolB-like protein